MNHFLATGYLSLPEAASHCSVSVRTLKRWIAAGLPTRQGIARGKLLLRADEIDVFLTRRSAKPDLDTMVNEVIADIRTAPPQSTRNGQRQRCLLPMARAN